jgi:hypothetical protein
MLSRLKRSCSGSSFLFCFLPEFLHSSFVIRVQIIDFLFLEVSSIPDVFERKCSVDDDVLYTIDVKVPSLFEALGDEGGDISVSEDVDDFIVVIFVLFGGGAGVGTFLVYFFPEFAHGEFALVNGVEEG